jgi:hypothetical protein
MKGIMRAPVDGAQFALFWHIGAAATREPAQARANRLKMKELWQCAI